jgi:hypothetical protein
MPGASRKIVYLKQFVIAPATAIQHGAAENIAVNPINLFFLAENP